MSKKYHVQRHELLNIYTNWRAYVIATVEDTSHLASCCEHHDDRDDSEVYFQIASCRDQLDLHFSLATPEDRENSLHKANKLAEVVNAFRDAIEKEIGIINERDATQQHARAASAVH
jgi:hypothetical protein